MNSALEQKELGLFAVELNNMDFVFKAREVARLICTVSGSVTVDQIRTHPAMKGLQPSSPNTWGAIFTGKHWRVVDETRSTITSNHHRRIYRWRYEP